MRFNLGPHAIGEPVIGAGGKVTARGLPGIGIYDILDFARLPVAILEGAQHIVRYVNPALCSLTGKTREELAGKAFGDIVKGDRCLSLLDGVYRTGKTESHTEQGQTESHPFFWSYEIWPVLVGDDRPWGVMIEVMETVPFHRRAAAINEALLVSAVRQQEVMEAAETLNAEQLRAEVKERKLAQEALLQSELLAGAGRLAASIAHEINNPLAAVVNTLYLARTAPGLPDAAREYLEMADGELMRIAHITRQTLGFYRESSAATSNSASAVMASVIDLLQAKIKASRATVEHQCSEDSRVVAVAGELRQILANLLANSLDAVEENGAVKLRCSIGVCPRTGRRRIRMTVADNGKGIGAAEMKKIFEPFFTTKGTVGTGLGLWVCKELIDKNGGSIRVRSNTWGKRRGTTFSFVLPGETNVSSQATAA